MPARVDAIEVRKNEVHEELKTCIGLTAKGNLVDAMNFLFIAFQKVGMKDTAEAFVDAIFGKPEALAKECRRSQAQLWGPDPILLH